VPDWLPLLLVLLALAGVGMVVAGARLECREQDQSTDEPAGRTRTRE
jgi:hypothetical protein